MLQSKKGRLPALNLNLLLCSFWKILSSLYFNVSKIINKILNVTTDAASASAQVNTTLGLVGGIKDP